MWLNSYGFILLFACMATVLAADDEDNEDCNRRASICITKTSYRVCKKQENGESNAMGPTFQCPANFVCDSEEFYGSCHLDSSSTASTAAPTQTTPTSTTTTVTTTTTTATPPTWEYTSSSSTTDLPLTTSHTTTDYTYSTDEPIDFTGYSTVTSSTTTPNYSSVDDNTPKVPSTSGKPCPGGPNTVNRQIFLDFNFAFGNNGLRRQYRSKSLCLINFPPWLRVSLCPKNDSCK